MKIITIMVKGLKEFGNAVHYTNHPYIELKAAYKYAQSLKLIGANGELTKLGELFYEKAELSSFTNKDCFSWELDSDNLWEAYVVAQHS